MTPIRNTPGPAMRECYRCDAMARPGKRTCAACCQALRDESNARYWAKPSTLANLLKKVERAKAAQAKVRTSA